MRVGRIFGGKVLNWSIGNRLEDQARQTFGSQNVEWAKDKIEEVKFQKDNVAEQLKNAASSTANAAADKASSTYVSSSQILFFIAAKQYFHSIFLSSYSSIKELLIDYFSPARRHLNQEQSH